MHLVEGMYWYIYYTINRIWFGEVWIPDYLGELTEIQHLFVEFVSFVYLLAVILLPAMVVVSIFKYLIRRFYN